MTADFGTHELTHRLAELMLRSGDRDVGDLVDQLRWEFPLADPVEIRRIVDQGLRRADGLGMIAPLLDDDTISEIMINGAGPVWVERDGHLFATDVELSDEDTALLAARLLDPLGLVIDRLHPTADARMSDGSRVNVVIAPLALNGTTITIRRFRPRPVPLEQWGPDAVTELLEQAVRAGDNICVIGGTSSGKTTLLNTLGRLLPASERIITIEDTAELQLGLSHVVRLEARPANAEGLGEVTMRDLVKNALRMRPNRIIVGETRGAEALDLLLALTSGHRGSFTTVHADHPAGAVQRLAVLASLAGTTISDTALATLVHDAIDLIAHVGRDGHQRVLLQLARLSDHGSVDVLWRR